MGKFRDLFKVRQPGNGDAFQKSVERAGRVKTVEIRKGTPNGGPRKAVSR